MASVLEFLCERIPSGLIVGNCIVIYEMKVCGQVNTITKADISRDLRDQSPCHSLDSTRTTDYGTLIVLFLKQDEGNTDVDTWFNFGRTGLSDYRLSQVVQSFKVYQPVVDGN